MTQAEARQKLRSVRHYCFMRGILGHVPSSQPLSEEVTAEKLAIFLSGLRTRQQPDVHKSRPTIHPSRWPFVTLTDSTSRLGPTYKAESLSRNVSWRPRWE